MGWQGLRQAMPTVVLHMTAAAIHVMATAALGGFLTSGYGSVLAALVMAAPMGAVLAMLAGENRVGAGLLLLSYLGTSGLVLYGHLGLGLIQLVMEMPASPWKVLFFLSAALLPLLQITGILEAFRFLGLRRRSELHVINK